MNHRAVRRSPGPWVLVLLLLGAEWVDTRQTKQDGSSAQVTRVLWRDPGPIAVRDLSWRSDPTHQPPIPPFTLVKKDTSGTRIKVVVKDINGVTWNVKLADGPDAPGEVHSEVAAARLAWALGYFAEESYYVADGAIEGAAKLGRASKAIGPDGRFRIARFEKRPAEIVRTGDGWSFDRNPFVGTKELSGLMILMTMTNSWDLGGTRNMTVLKAPGENGAGELRYLVSDLGATFGRMDRAALVRHRTKWSLEDFRKQKFIDRATKEFLDLHFTGDGAIDLVPMAHARWFAGLVTQLTAEQLRQAFEVAGATPEEVDGFSARLLEKINLLNSAVVLSAARR